MLLINILIYMYVTSGNTVKTLTKESLMAEKIISAHNAHNYCNKIFLWQHFCNKQNSFPQRHFIPWFPHLLKEQAHFFTSGHFLKLPSISPSLEYTNSQALIMNCALTDKTVFFARTNGHDSLHMWSSVLSVFHMMYE